MKEELKLEDVFELLAMYVDNHKGFDILGLRTYINSMVMNDEKTQIELRLFVNADKNHNGKTLEDYKREHLEEYKSAYE